MMSAPVRTPHPPDLAGARVVVVGAARSGVALARFLLSRRARVTISDARGAPALGEEVAALGREGAALDLGGHDERRFLEADLVAVSPGVPLDIRPLAAARRRGVRIVAEVELASWFLEGAVIGITGTNGKSTTTALVAHLLAQGGLKATACGNIGKPLTGLIADDAPDRHYVVELSSFQLEGIEAFRPRIAALLNLSPDHQDRYPEPAAYYRAKARIFMNQEPGDDAVLNRDDPEVWRLAPSLQARVHPFSRAERLDEGACLERDAIVVRRGGREIRDIPLSSVPLFGAHNIENVMTALLVADLCGVPMARAHLGLRSFRGLPHRLEKVRDLDGVAYYNDSKATNVGATVKSLESFPGRVVLILGGKDKGGDFAELVPLIRQRVMHLVLMGEARDAIESQIGTVVPATKVAAMGEAIEAARAAASPGSVVLLAPACASFDQYSGFEERGEDFRRRVLALRGGPTAGGSAA
ncbi:MAG: UDP-N-acetylmuramoyl-L-alanine--D-glutamate ligase [Acidobacteria bacterium]|nr:UDP-N-acetylmuramoyl-L-alanine--D-glutamate ligase [Acidobacteriota bacterium]